MMICLYITTALLIVYGILMQVYQQWWREVKIDEGENGEREKKVFVSVVIPARNEEKNIEECLSSLLAQQYPAQLTEILVVDDQSVDNTAAIVQRFSPRVTLLQIPPGHTSASPKKTAIETGIKAAKGELIVSTDADCTAGINWISRLAASYSQGLLAIAAPVRIKTNSSLISKFQSLDFLTMQGITGAGISARIHHMANGANFAYSKNTFAEVNGFSGNETIASGDDMFLIQKIAKQFPGKIIFLKNPDAIVDTLPVETWKAFLQQRIRWAGKARAYKEKELIAVLVLVYLTNLAMLSMLAMSFFEPVAGLLFLVLCTGKFFMELPFVYTVSKFFKQENLIPWLLILQPIHIVYIVISGFFGQINSYEWKGRKLN